MKNLRLKISIYLFLLVGVLLSSKLAQAQFLDPGASENIIDRTEIVQNAAGYDADTSLGAVVAVAIKGFLSLLGIIFVILIIIAGFNWMTAAGDEEKIKKATATIRSAIIGLIIIVAAYAITYFVFRNLPGAGVN